MSNQDSKLSALLSPSRAGTYFAPFRARSANPDGFDIKMEVWIGAIEEWAVKERKLTFSLQDIREAFASDSNIRPDKECLRLVFSEMKRRSLLVSHSKVWTRPAQPIFNNIIDTRGWIGWGLKKFVIDPTAWAISAISNSQDQVYSDLIDLSISDTAKFMCQKSLDHLASELFKELRRIAEAEKQYCFEWESLIKLIEMSSIIDNTDHREFLEIIDLLLQYLTFKKHVAIQTDEDLKLVKIANLKDPKEDEVAVTKRDVAIVRFLRLKSSLKAEENRYYTQAQEVKREALECYQRKEVEKAKSLLKTHHQLLERAGQKNTQLLNVEDTLDQLESTDSNMMILKAYKSGADALKDANTNLEANRSHIDDLYDATAEAREWDNEISQMLRDVSCTSQRIFDADLEDELNEYIVAEEKNLHPPSKTTDANVSVNEGEAAINDKFVNELEEKLNSLVICQDEPAPAPEVETSVESEALCIPST